MPIEMTGGSPFPAGRRPALSAHAAGLRLLLVPARGACARGSFPAPRPAPELFTLVLSASARLAPQGTRAARLSSATSCRASSRRSAGSPARASGIESAARRRFRRADGPAGPRRLPAAAGRGRSWSGGERQRYFMPLAVAEEREEDALLPYAVARVSARPSRRAAVRRQPPRRTLPLACCGAMPRQPRDRRPPRAAAIRYPATAALDGMDVDLRDVKRLSGRAEQHLDRARRRR